MKKINCPFEEKQQKVKNYLRCINIDTLDYVDIPIARGLSVADYWPIVKNADRLSGRTTCFSSDVIKEYNYACFVRINIIDGSLDLLEYEKAFTGFLIDNNVLYRLFVDIETNKILERENLESNSEYYVTEKYNHEAKTWTEINRVKPLYAEIETPEKQGLNS